MTTLRVVADEDVRAPIKSGHGKVNSIVARLGVVL
jgi:hypothetical protein